MERGENMGIQRPFVSLIILLIISVTVAGCSGKSKADLDAAKAAADKAKTTLASMKTEMEAAISKLQAEKDGLAAQIKTLTSDLDKAKTDLAAAVKDRDGLQEQIKKLTGDQAGAVAEAQKKSQTLIEELKAQLAALTTKFTTMQGENGKLQATIKELQEKLKNIGTNLIPKM